MSLRVLRQWGDTVRTFWGNFFHTYRLACRTYRAGLLVMGLSLSAPVAAMLDIEITQGVSSALPIAVFSFASGYQKNGLTQDVGEIVRQDLLRSGQFRLAATDNAPDVYRVEDLKRHAGLLQQTDTVVLGSMKPVGRDKVAVDFSLVDVLLATQETGKGIVLSQRFVVSNQQLRALAHHIADLVYEKMTGIPGVFSTKIAYVNVKRQGHRIDQYVLELSDVDGHNPRPLLISPEPIMSPRWDPTGKRLAYVSFERKRSGVYILNVESGERRLVAAYPGINGAPSWSPDGHKLALVLSHERSPKIYVLDLAGKQLQQITKGNYLDTEPAWSPDGASLVFTSNRGGKPQIYRYVFASGATERLTYEGDYNARASFTPDGRKLVMLHRTADRYNIAVQDLETGMLQVLTHSHLDESPSISPNGQRVMYAIRDGRQIVLGEVSLDSRVQLRLPARDGDVQEPAWSPFLAVS